MPLAEIAKHLPKRNGRGVSRSTLYRWVKYGLKGHKLAYVQVGGTRCTSMANVEKFFASLSSEPQVREEKAPEKATKEAKAAGARLAARYYPGTRHNRRQAG
jgi:hypothetical protein